MTDQTLLNHPSRRTFLSATLATAAAVGLSACGAGSAPTSADSSQLTVLVEAGGHGELQPIADQFEKDTGTAITFVELPYDGLYNRLSSELRGGGASFDLAALDSIWLPAFYTSLTPLDDLFTDEVTADLFPALVTEAKVGESFVGMPVWTNTEILYYRTDLFDDPQHQQAYQEAYGEELTVPQTWQQYRQVAEYFTQAGAGSYYGTDVKGAVETEWLATLSQAGETVMVADTDGHVSLGSPESQAALDFYTSLLPFAPAGAAQLDWAGAQNLFNQGQLAMTRFWGHAYRQVPEDSPVHGKVGVAPMIGAAAGPAGVPGAWYLGVAASSKKQDKALEFVRYAFEHNELAVDTSLGLTARVSVMDTMKDQAGYEHFAPMLETLNAPATRPRPALPQWQEIVDTALIPMIQKAVEDGADNAALLADAKAQVESIVSK